MTNPDPPAVGAAATTRRPWYLLLPLGALLLGWWHLAEPYRMGETYAGFDLAEQVLPWRAFMAYSLDQGELGFWNPFLARGYNHLAEGQAGVLHPLHWLLYGAMPVSWGVTIELLLPMPLAVLGGWLCLRRGMRLRPEAAIAGAILMGANVFYHAHFMHVNMALVAAHMPWLLWAAYAVLTRRSMLAAAGFALLMASMWLLGHPQAVWLNGLAVAGLIAVCGARDRLNLAWRNGLALLVTALIAGTLMGMPQILPSAAALANSPRADVSTVERTNFSLHPLNLLVQGAPYLMEYRILPVPTTESDGTTEMIHSYQEFPAYIGIGFLTLLAMLAAAGRSIWLAADRRRLLWAWGAALLLLLLLVVGRYGGLIHLLAHLPIVGQFRAPSRYIAPFIGLLALGLAYGLHRLAQLSPDTLREQDPHALRRAGWTAGGVLAFCLGCLVAGLVAAGQGGLPVAGHRLPIETNWTLRLAPLAVVLAVAALTLGWLRRRNPLLLAVAIAICAADMGNYAVPVVRGVARPEPRMHMARLDAAPAAMAAGITHPYRMVAGTNTPYLEGNLMANGYLGLPPPDRLVLNPADGPAATMRQHLRLASVDRIQTDQRTIPFPDGLPRARLVRDYVVADPTAIDHPDQPYADDADIADRAYLDNSAAVYDSPEARVMGQPLQPGETVTITRQSPQSIVLDVQVQAERVVILSDRYDAGWRAVDRPRDVMSAFDGHMMAISVGPQSETIELRYRPPGLIAGGALAALGLLMVLAMLVLARRRPADPQGQIPATQPDSTPLEA